MENYIRTDAVISPANSFRFMDGGIDLLYCRRFGWHVQVHLQARIATKDFGDRLIWPPEIIAKITQPYPI